MQIRSNELIREYSDSLEEFTHEQINEVVRSAFRYTSDVMKTGELEPIRFTGFGLFSVNPGAVIYNLINLEDKSKLEYITLVLEEHIKANPLKFKRYAEKVKRNGGMKEERKKHYVEIIERILQECN